MTDYTTIQNWWTIQSKRYRNYMGSGYDFIVFLGKQIQQSEQDEKIEFIDFLTQKAINQEEDYAIAFSLLEKYCTDKCLELIFEKAQTIDFADQNIIYYLNVIGKRGNEKHKQLLTEYVLSDKLNENQSFVHWSLYPNFPDLFAKAYSKYLIETDYKVWTGSAVVQSFMTHPKAVTLMKDYLEVNNKKVWTYFKNDLRQELTKDFWNKTNKKEIATIIYS
jgi:hypothetical protein